jgi:2-polyprenyl-6-methoxyphenol hydroxylase-like FAD-dependent oxidoreductase
MSISSRTRALVVGAGKIGTAIAGLLASVPDYDVTVLDPAERAQRSVESGGVCIVRATSPCSVGWPVATT